MKKKFLAFGLLFPFLIFGYTISDASNAGFLTGQRIITLQSSTAEYRLDDNLTRAELIGIALKMKGIRLPDEYVCRDYFVDVSYNPVNNWICRAVELAVDNGIISAKNKKARPQDTATRAESLAMVLHAAFGDKLDIKNKGYQFSDDTVDWQQSIFYAGEEFISISGDYSAMNYVYSGRPNMPIFINYFPNTPVTRAEIFDVLVNVINNISRVKQ